MPGIPQSTPNLRFIPWFAQNESDPNVLSRSSTLSRKAWLCSHRAITVNLFLSAPFVVGCWLLDIKGRPSARMAFPCRASEMLRLGEIRISGVWTITSVGFSGSIWRRRVEIRKEEVRWRSRGDWAIITESAQLPYQWRTDDYWLATWASNNFVELNSAVNKSHKQQFQLITASGSHLTIRERPF